MLTFRKLVLLFLLFTVINTVALLFIQSRQSELLNTTRDTLQNLDTQRTAVTSMSHATRERSLILLRMTYIDDAFEREEMSEQFSSQANIFLENLNTLNQTHLNDTQSALIDKVLQLVQPTSLMLVESIEMMRDEQLQQAADMVMSKVLPNQDKIVKQLDELLDNITRKANQQLTASLEFTQENRQYFMLLMAWIVMQVVIGTAILFVKFKSDSKKLKNLEKINESVLETAFDAIVSFDEQGRLSRFNRAAENLSGYKYKEVIGRKLTKLVPKKFVKQIYQLLKDSDIDASVNFRGLNSETMLIDRDGREIPVTVSISDTGIPGNFRFTAILHDMSQIKAALSEIEQQKHAMDEHSIVSITDINGTIIYVNDLFCTISGYSREEMIGRNHSILNASDRDRQYWDRMYECLNAGKTWHDELHNRAKDGRNYWVHTSIVPFKDPHGRLKNFVAISTDITHRVESQQALSIHQEKLEQLIDERTRELLIAKDNAEAANREKSRFLANMSHELRTPMHAIQSFSSLGFSRIETAGQEKLKTYFSRIMDSSERLTILLNDLLDLSKMEAGKMDYHFEQLNILSTINEVIEELRPLASNRQINLKLITELKQLEATFDNQRIMQVIRNLLSNAIKFSPENSEIKIHLEQSANMPDWEGNILAEAVVVRVEDQGVGIPEDELGHIFEQFIQSSKTDNNAGGTGLGLAISREIIHAHHGNILARNNVQGATLEFIIPLAQPN